MDRHHYAIAHRALTKKERTIFDNNVTFLTSQPYGGLLMCLSFVRILAKIKNRAFYFELRPACTTFSQKREV